MAGCRGLDGGGDFRTERGWLHPASPLGAFEERLAQIALQSLDLLCQDGLCGPEGLGCLSECGVGQRGSEAFESLSAARGGVPGLPPEPTK